MIFTCGNKPLYGPISLLYIALLAGGVLCSAGVGAQQAAPPGRDMDCLRDSHPWLSGGNVLGLQFLPQVKISDAKISFGKSDGKFIDFYQSGNSYTIGASTESFYRLKPNIAFHGKVDYTDFTGKNMGGSAFVDPYKSPLDIDEYADSTKGTKRLERYALLGGIAARLNGRWTLGGQIDYEAANYAKFRDLRPVSKLLDLKTEAAVGYKAGNALQLGLAYDYIRRIESLSFGVYGNTNREYLSLIDFGSFFGKLELYGAAGNSPGYTLQANPMVADTHRFSIQADWRIGPRLEWFSDVYYGRRSGYFGEKGTTGIVFTEDHAQQYGYKGILSLRQGYSLHNLAFGGSYEDLKNWLNVYRAETDTGGTTTIAYYGQNQVLDRKITRAELGYTGYLGLMDNNPVWVIKATADYYRRQQTVILYPFYRQEVINSYRVGAVIERNFASHENRYGLSFGLAYGSGGGTPRNDSVYVSPSSGQAAPATKDSYLYQEYEFFTKPRVEGRIGVKYGRPLKEGLTGFVRFDIVYTRAFDVKYTGNTFRTAAVMVGCAF